MLFLRNFPYNGRNSIKASADKRLISPDELIQGAKISTATELVNMMTSPDYKVFTF